MTGAVYFIRVEDDGPIKIGFTRKGPAGRIAQLQLASPWKLRMLGFVFGSKHHERALHERLEGHRMQGEWFAPDPKVLALINLILAIGLERAGVELSLLDLAIAKAGSNFLLGEAIGVNSAVISSARKGGMGPDLAGRVSAYLEQGAA